jgi:hypothetical protein
MLTIKDLSVSKELDSEALATVHGGTGLPAVDFQNSFNVYDIWNSLDYRPDYSTDIIAQLNVGDINANNNFGSVVIPQLAQSNGGANF